jgi:hypothetical protein
VRTRHLAAELECGLGFEAKHKRPDGERLWHRGAWGHVVQSAEELGSVKQNADLFDGFPDGGSQQVHVVRLGTTAGKGHVTGPRVTRTLRTANEEDRQWIGSEQDSDGGLRELCAVRYALSAVSQSRAELFEVGVQRENLLCAHGA